MFLQLHFKTHYLIIVLPIYYVMDFYIGVVGY